MLYDMRGTYIRRESYGFEDDGLPNFKMVAFALVVSAALLYLSFRWGTPFDADAATALYAP